MHSKLHGISADVIQSAVDQCRREDALIGLVMQALKKKKEPQLSHFSL